MLNFSINIENAEKVSVILDSLRNLKPDESWDRKKIDMLELGVNGEEIFENIVRTFHRDFDYVLYIDLLGGHVYWFNTKLYDEFIDEKNSRIYLKRKNDEDWYIVYDNGVFYPSYKCYLLNGYSYCGKNNLRYPCLKLKSKKGIFEPRVHQLIALFGLGIKTFDTLGESRTLEINHLDAKVVDGKVTNNSLKDLEITTREGNLEYRDIYRERKVLVKKGNGVVFNI
ncbi:hypothetical protein MKY25_03500 [Geobacillus sp. FSL W8-0032]|uniref:hypothetical protein n=1 Tax=Geobacillus sp. FSL W8-0032 TaxID=2921730 RepID=UPI0031589C91